LRNNKPEYSERGGEKRQTPDYKSDKKQKWETEGTCPRRVPS